MLETEFLRSYQLSAATRLYLFERPGAMAIVGIMIFSLVMTAWGKRRQAKLEAEEAAAMERIAEEERAAALAASPAAPAR
jgi:putative tricarboxylic transport membrane protein